MKYFHSSLNNTKCSVDDYNYAKEIYNYFGCEEISDYNDLYVKTDLYVFCISAPGFSNRAMLKMTNGEIKLITDIDMLSFYGTVRRLSSIYIKYLKRIITRKY